MTDQGFFEVHGQINFTNFDDLLVTERNEDAIGFTMMLKKKMFICLSTLFWIELTDQKFHSYSCFDRKSALVDTFKKLL